MKLIYCYFKLISQYLSPIQFYHPSNIGKLKTIGSNLSKTNGNLARKMDPDYEDIESPVKIHRLAKMTRAELKKSLHEIKKKKDF